MRTSNKEKIMKQKPIPQVGQKLWMVSGKRTRFLHEHEVEVTRVGKKYFYVNKTDAKWRDEIKCHISDWSIDGGGYSSDGECYLNKEEYETKLKTDKAWTAFYRAIQTHHYNKNDNVTYENIIEAAKLLNLELILD